MSIEVKNITYTYGKGLPHESVALKDVSLSIEKGTFLGVIGHTGSGKSTLLQHFNGLLKPDKGTILINGMNITDSKTTAVEMRKKTGLVFQYPEYQLFEETVEKDISFGPKNLGMSQEEIEKRVKDSMKLVDISYEEFKDKSPFELSGGQKRRVAIAGVLAMEPEVLILDEPTAGLDPKTHKDILSMIRKIHKEWQGITILVSHNMDDIANYCDRAIVIDEGKIIMEGTPREIFQREKELVGIGLSLPKATKMYKMLKEEGLLEKAFDNDTLAGSKNSCKNEQVQENERITAEINMPLNMEELIGILKGNLC